MKKILTLKKKFNIPKFKVVTLQITEDGSPFFMEEVGLSQVVPKKIVYKKGEYINYNTIRFASIGLIAVAGYLAYKKFKK